MYVVDGYNAIRRIDALSRAESSRGLEAGRDALLSTIVASGVLARHRVLVVFDGVSEVVSSMPRLHRSLAVRFSRAPQTADRAIVELLQKGASAVTVVTADRDLQLEVRRMGASVVEPSAWEGLRGPSRRKRRTSPPPARDDKPQPSSGDVSYWLEVFGEGQEGDR